MGLADLEEARGPKPKYLQSQLPPEAYKKDVFPCFFQFLVALCSLAARVTLFLLYVL